MKYEFLFQPQEPGAAFEPANLEGVLSARGATARPDSVWVWELKHGPVELRRLSTDGKPVAMELKVPFSGKTDLVAEAVIEGVSVADALGLRLVDLQLNRALRPSDAAAVADSFLETARYAGEYMGVSEAVDAGFYKPGEEDAGTSGTTFKVLLALLVFGLALYLAWRAALG